MPSCNSNVDVSEYDDMEKVLAKQTGGSIGYNLRMEEPLVGGQAVVKGYSVQPKLEAGQFIESDTDALCDPTAMTGGGSRNNKSKRKRSSSNRSNNKRSSSNRSNNKRSSSNRSNNKRSSKRSNKSNKSKRKRSSKRSNKSNRRRSNNKRSSGNKSKNKHSSGKRNSNSRKRRRMRGGNAPYEASYTNQESVYSPDMESRAFGCKQPEWNTNCA